MHEDWQIIAQLTVLAKSGGVAPAVACRRLQTALDQITRQFLGDPRDSISFSDPEGKGRIIR